MNKLIYTLFLCLCILISKSQINESRKHFVFNKQATINFENITTDFAPVMLVKEMPKPASEKMVQYNYPETKEQAKISQSNSILPTLALGYSAIGNPWGGSTPNDNDVAISDSGYVMSVINTNIYVKNINTGVASPIKSLAAFTTPVNSKHQESDPKVLYDPKSLDLWIQQVN